MSDRIMVMHEGHVTGFLDRAEANQVSIMELAAQVAAGREEPRWQRQQHVGKDRRPRSARDGQAPAAAGSQHPAVLVGIALVFEILGWIFIGQSFLLNPQRLTDHDPAGVGDRHHRRRRDPGHHHRRHRPVVRLGGRADGDDRRQPGAVSRLGRGRVYPVAHRPAGLRSDRAPGWASACAPASSTASLIAYTEHPAVHRHARHDGHRRAAWPNGTRKGQPVSMLTDQLRLRSAPASGR